MVRVPFNQIEDSKLVENTFSRLQFQDGQSNAIASLQTKYAMLGPKEIYDEVIGGSSSKNIKEHFKDVELEEGP